MRILLLSAHPAHSLSDSQGYTTRILGLAQGLAELGHEVVPLIAGDQRGHQTAQRVYKRGLKRFLPRRVAQLLRELSFLAMDRQFYAQCRRKVGRIAPDVILERYSYFTRTGLWLARRFGLPLVLDDIAPVWEEERYYRRELKSVARRIQGQVFARADAFVAVSGAIRTYMVQMGVPDDKIHVLHNGADCDLFSPDVDGAGIRERFGLAGMIVVGFVGGFLPWHGIEALLDLAQQMAAEGDRTAFLLVGPVEHCFDSDPALKHKMQELRAGGYIVLAGAVPHPQVPSYVAAMDIALMPASNSYGSPIKILEYMAAGKAVVAPRLPPIEEIITHGQDGWLVDPDDAPSLANAIDYLIQHPEIRQQLGLKARETVSQRFTWKRHAQQLGLVFEGICQLRQKAEVKEPCASPISAP